MKQCFSFHSGGTCNWWFIGHFKHQPLSVWTGFKHANIRVSSTAGMQEWASRRQAARKPSVYGAHHAPKVAKLLNRRPKLLWAQGQNFYPGFREVVSLKLSISNERMGLWHIKIWKKIKHTSFKTTIAKKSFSWFITIATIIQHSAFKVWMSSLFKNIYFCTKYFWQGPNPLWMRNMIKKILRINTNLSWSYLTTGFLHVSKLCVWFEFEKKPWLTWQTSLPPRHLVAPQIAF